jgi:hypothetical protein
MADTFIQLPVDSTGKKVRSFSSVVGPDTVHSQAATLVDSDGNVMNPFQSGRLDVHIGASGVTLPVSDNGGSLTVDTPQLPDALSSAGNLKVTSPETNNGKTVNYLTSFPVGTTTIPAVPGARHKVIGFVLATTANNTTLVFNDGAALMGNVYTGDASAGRIVVPPNIQTPVVEAGVGNPLNIVVTGSAVSGVLQYITEP